MLPADGFISQTRDSLCVFFSTAIATIITVEMPGHDKYTQCQCLMYETKILSIDHISYFVLVGTKNATEIALRENLCTIISLFSLLCAKFFPYRYPTF